jgi:hypothetical protein
LPAEVPRGEITDPVKRLRELIHRIGGHDNQNGALPLRNAVTDLVQFLEVDVPELIDAVRAAQEEARQARRELAGRAGTQYQLVISSDAPLAVTQHRVIQPEGDEDHG